MNEQLQAKLVEIITSIQNATRAASDFTMEQLPDIATSYILYGRVRSLVIIGVCAALLVACVFGARTIAGLWRKYNDPDDFTVREEPIGTTMAGGAVILVTGIFSTLSLLFNIEQALLVWLAPKVWLITKLAELVK